MNTVRVSCAGLQVGPVYLPAFELRASELLCIHLPGPVNSSGDGRLVEILTGALPVPELRFSSQVEHAHIPLARRGLLGFFGRQRALHWFRQAAGTSRAEALAVMQRLGIDADRPVGEFATNPRTLLALEAAWARGAKVVVFSTAGCDPLGRQAAFQAVLAKLDQCAAIHLCYPLVDRPRICPPRGVCVEVIKVSPASSAAS